jgi:hypothetical protein
MTGETYVGILTTKTQSTLSFPEQKRDNFSFQRTERVHSENGKIKRKKRGSQEDSWSQGQVRRQWGEETIEKELKGRDRTQESATEEG